MLVAPTSGENAVQYRNGTRLTRSTSLTETRSAVIWRRRKRESKGTNRQLSCVVEHTDNSIDCLQHQSNKRDRKDCGKGPDRYSTGSDLTSEMSYDPLPGRRNMAWRNKSSPSPVPSDGGSSWIDSLSSKLNDKRKKANGLFGSLRGKSSKDKRRQSGGIMDGLFNTPRSPLLGSRQASPPKILSGKNLLQDSTGFNPDHEGIDSPLCKRLMSSEFGSCHELSSKTSKQEVVIRKTHSLPRSVLFSPIMSRKVKKPTSQWLQNDHLLDDCPLPDSPLSSLLSSNHGSSETIQPLADAISVTTPTEKEGALGWKSASPREEPVQKTGLTRSSSLPFETLDIESSIPKREVPGRLSLGGSTSGPFASGRLATRSQSFNTHFSTHSHVQRTQSQESMALREHIVRFLLETEQSYISSLRSLSKDYQDVLYQIDCRSLQEVLLLVPSLASKHEEFSELVSERVNDWYSNQCIGDVLVQTFSHQQFNKLYTMFINHYSKARTALDNAKQAKHSLSKALEELSRESHGKLTVEDLLIKPVQRIPRYLLFVKDLIKQTHPSHPDYLQLQQAQQELSKLANHVNESERESERLQQHKDLLATVEGLNEVLNESSTLLRCDTITEIRGTAQKKDRLLLLYSDMLICASSRRRSSGFRKGSLMNVNSIQADNMLRYHIKWRSVLSILTINQSPAPLMERRRYNTLEKTLHNLHKDEAVILQMMSTSSTIQYPHNELDIALQNVLSSVRSTMTRKRQEMETLPQDTTRIDITLHEGSPPPKYSFLFPSQKDRYEWEQLMRSTQLSLTQIQEGKKKVPQKKPLSPESIPRYLWSVVLPTCRVGSQLSSIAIPSGGSSNQFFVCVNDVCGRGNIAILNSSGRTSKDTPPSLVATLPLSSSRLLCSLCVEHPPEEKQTETDGGYDDSVSGVSISSDDYLLDCDDSFFPYTPPTPSNETLDPAPMLTPKSGSLPPTSRYNVATSYVIPSKEKPYQLAPPIPDGNQWLWLGSEEGILYILKVGVASLHVSSSFSIDVGSAVICLTAGSDYTVWAGLTSGRIAVFNLHHHDISHPDRYVTVSSSPVVAIACIDSKQNLVATANSIISVDNHWFCKELFSLSETITNMVVNERWIFISVESSLTIRVYSCDVTTETIMTIDCTASVTASLKYYNPIIKQHKCTNCYITNMTVSDKMLVIGTSAGVVVALPLPFTPGKIPSIHALSRGHVDTISTLVVLQQGHRHILISGGHGLEELLKAKSSDNISETEGCLLFWYLSTQKVKLQPT